MPIYVCFGWQFNAQKGIFNEIIICIYNRETLMRTHSKCSIPLRLFNRFIVKKAQYFLKGFQIEPIYV